MAALAEAFVRLRPDTTGFGRETERDIDRSTNLRPVGERKGREFGDGLNRGTRGGLGELVTSLNRTAGAVLTNVPAFVAFSAAGLAAAATASRFAAAVAPAAGAALLLPAAGLAGAAAIATLKIAFSGVSDALKAGLAGDTEKYAEATKNMAGSARLAVGAIVALKPQLDGIHRSVQGAVFAGWNRDIKAAGSTLLPVLKTQLTETGTVVNAAGHQLGLFGARSQTARDLAVSLGNVNAAARPLAGVLAPVLSILTDLTVVGSTRLPGLTSGFAGAAQSAAAFVSQARQTGQLDQIITNALTTIRQIGGVLTQVGGIASAVWTAMNTGGGGVLVTLQQVLLVVNQVLSSAEGQQAMVTVFSSLRQITAALAPALGGVLIAVLPLVPALARLAATVGVALADAIIALTPLIESIATRVADWATKLSENKALFDGIVAAVAGASGWLNDHLGLVGAVAAAYGVWRVALVAYAAGQAIGTGYTIAANAATAVHTGVMAANNAVRALGTTYLATWIGVKALESAAWARTMFATAGATATMVTHSAATAANNAVTVVSNAIRSVSIAAIGAWLAAKAAELGAWIASTARTVAHTVALGAHIAVMGAVRLATLAWTAGQWLLNAALTANPIGLVIAAIALLVGAFIYAWRNSETFRNVVTGAWTGIRDAATTAWNWMRDSVFSPLARFITQTIPNAFRAGTDAIAGAWARVREVAAAPVRFVIDTVINKGIIDTFNVVAGFFGAKKVGRVAVPFADGGVLPGYTPGRDVYRFMHPSGMALDVSGGEAFMRPEFTAAVGADTINTWNGAARTGGVAGVRRVMGFADGGVLGFITNPAGWFKDRVGGPIGDVARRFGSNPFVEMVVSGGRRLIDAAIEKGKSLVGFGGGALGGAGGAIGWQAMWNIIKAAFPSAQLFSAFRPGDMAESGLSYHASGRAIDITPSIAIGRWIAAHYGAMTKELIHTPMGAEQIWNGRRHVFTGAALQAAHYNHVHWAMANGGLLPRMSMDTGFGVLKPGRNVVDNGTGRAEPIAAGPVRLDDWTIARLAQAMSARPVQVGIDAPGWNLSVAGVVP